MNVAIWVSTCGQRSRSRPTIRSRVGGGRGQQQRGEHAEGALGEDVPRRRRGRPRTGDRPSHVDPLAGAEERQGDGEAARTAARSAPASAASRGRTRASAATTGDQHGVPAEGPERLARGGHHGDGEQHHRRDLHLGREPVHRRVAVAGTARARGRRPSRTVRPRRPRRRRRRRRRRRSAAVAPAASAATAHQPEQPAADREGEQHAEHPGQAGGEERVVDAPDAVVGERAVGQLVVLAPAGPCSRRR